jgi:hypothetical protein
VRRTWLLPPLILALASPCTASAQGDPVAAAELFRQGREALGQKDYATARVLASDPERATQLFKQGREAMAAHEYALACQKFIESEGADPHVGTLINLAQCEEPLSKLAASRQYWQQALDLGRATSDPRIDYIERELARIDSRVPRLTVLLAPTAPPDTVLRCDGVEFASASFGVPLPVETGAHALMVSAPQHEPRGYNLEVKEGEHREIVVEPGPRAPASDARAGRTTSAPPTSIIQLGGPGGVPAGSSSTSATSGMGTPRTIAIVVGGIGVAGIVAGGIFGAMAMSKNSDAKNLCPGSGCPTQQGVDAWSDALAFGNVSTVSLIAGGVLLAGGAALWFTSKPKTTQVGVGPGSITLKGVW